jgi:hypothetical protein
VDEINIIAVIYANDSAMRAPFSSDCYVEKDNHYPLTNTVLQFIRATAPSCYICRILKAWVLFITVSSFVLPFADVFAQHMMMPPAASIGDRKIKLSFSTDPANIKSNQTVLTKLAFVDENTRETLQHVTVRMEISHSSEGRRLLSEFFHSHNGNIDISFRPAVGLRYAVTGNMDDLTNAWVADPGSPIIVNGPIFSQPGHYRILLEVTTVDNDKTDLPTPLKYDLNIQVS